MKHIFCVAISVLLLLGSPSLQAQPTENMLQHFRNSLPEPGSFEQILLNNAVVENKRCLNRYSPLLHAFKTAAQKTDGSTNTVKLRNKIVAMINSCAHAAHVLLERSLEVGLYKGGNAQRNYYESECGKETQSVYAQYPRIELIVQQLSELPVDSVKDRLTIYGDLSLAAHLTDAMNSQVIRLETHCDANGNRLRVLRKGSR